MKTVTYAPDAWRMLNGILCVYKPPGVIPRHVCKALALNLTRDLNCMEVRPPKNFIKIEGSVLSRKPFSVQSVPSFADNTLVVGPRYQPQDVKLNRISKLGKNTSGVHLMSVNNVGKTGILLRDANLLRTYEIKAELGYATDNLMYDGKVLKKLSYRHVKRHTVDRILASLQADPQASAFSHCGVDICSQEAYTLASKGIVRPAGDSPPIAYGIHCTDMNLPYITLKIQCINETEDYLMNIVHRLGLYLHCFAVCHQLRVIQYGHFTLDHALLRKHWTLEHVLGNIILCKSISDPEKFTPTSAHFQTISKEEAQKKISEMQEERRKEIL